MNKRILCFGDSNTWGFDPRSFLGERYPAEIRWTDLLGRNVGWEVTNLGRNGREIPHTPGALSGALAEIAAGGPGDLLIVMLGSNDLLAGTADAAGAAARMGVFLSALAAGTTPPVLLVSPPPMRRGDWVAEDRLAARSTQLGGCYRALAQQRGVAFADAAPWGIALTADGVHFSPEGHRRFAARLAEVLPDLLG